MKDILRPVTEEFGEDNAFQWVDSKKIDIKIQPKTQDGITGEHGGRLESK